MDGLGHIEMLKQRPTSLVWHIFLISTSSVKERVKEGPGIKSMPNGIEICSSG